MPRENLFTAALARLARFPFALKKKMPFEKPQKILFLHPCCLSHIMLATPLLAAVSRSFPDARIDWGVDSWARPAVAGNPRLTELINIGYSGIQVRSRSEIRSLIASLQEKEYDTCFIPSRSGILSYVAWQAGIKQRIGINKRGRGFAHTTAVGLPKEPTNAAVTNLRLAEAVGIDEEIIRSVSSEFYPSDSARLAVTQLLIEEIDWLGDVPLVIMHPGGGVNPLRSTPNKRWPVERFAVLGNHFQRHHGARMVLVGADADRPMVKDIAGLMAGKVSDLSGRLRLGEVGALCEVADFYVGNDAGPTHVAAATGCPTLAIYGPNDPIYSMPYSKRDNVVTLWRDLRDLEEERPFTWDIGVTAGEAIEAAETLLKQSRDREHHFEFLMGEKRSHIVDTNKHI